MLFTSNEPWLERYRRWPGHKTNVISRPALKGACDGASRRSPSEPTRPNMLEAFNWQVSLMQVEVREGSAQSRPEQSRNVLGRRCSLPFQQLLLSSLLMHRASTPALLLALFCHLGKSVYLLGPVSSFVNWEAEHLSHLPGQC